MRVAVPVIAACVLAACASVQVGPFKAGTARYDGAGKLTHVGVHAGVVDTEGRGVSLNPISIDVRKPAGVLGEVRVGRGASGEPGANHIGAGATLRAAHLHPDGSVNIGFFEVTNTHGNGLHINTLSANPVYNGGKLTGYTFTSRLNLGERHAGQPVWAIQGNTKVQIGTVSATGEVEFGVFQNAFRAGRSITIMTGESPAAVGANGSAVLTLKPVGEGKVDVRGFIPLEPPQAQ